MSSGSLYFSPYTRRFMVRDAAGLRRCALGRLRFRTWDAWNLIFEYEGRPLRLRRDRSWRGLFGPNPAAVLARVAPAVALADAPAEARHQPMGLALLSGTLWGVHGFWKFSLGALAALLILLLIFQFAIRDDPPASTPPWLYLLLCFLCVKWLLDAWATHRWPRQVRQLFSTTTTSWDGFGRNQVEHAWNELGQPLARNYAGLQARTAKKAWHGFPMFLPGQAALASLHRFGGRRVDLAAEVATADPVAVFHQPLRSHGLRFVPWIAGLLLVVLFDPLYLPDPPEPPTPWSTILFDYLVTWLVWSALFLPFFGWGAAARTFVIDAESIELWQRRRVRRWRRPLRWQATERGVSFAPDAPPIPWEAHGARSTVREWLDAERTPGRNHPPVDRTIVYHSKTPSAGSKQPAQYDWE